MKTKQRKFPGYYLMVGLLAAGMIMTAACGSKPTTTQTTEAIISLAISPVTPANLKLGFTQNFYATALYPSGATADVTSQVTWNSSDKTVADFTQLSGGLLTGLATGNVTVSAQYQGLTSNSVNITVTGSGF
jgi:Bacterial Ig-like domain (group 2)